MLLAGISLLVLILLSGWTGLGLKLVGLIQAGLGKRFKNEA